MSSTEGFNRIVSAHAGRLYFNQAKYNTQRPENRQV